MSTDLCFQRYLNAKRTVDDRALNRQVWDGLRTAVQAHDGPLRVLEVGCGTGTMIQRALDWDLFDRPVDYTAIDAEEKSITVAKRKVTVPDDWSLTLETWDVYDFIAQAGGQKWDVLIAHAFLDLFDIERLMPQLLGLLNPNGIYYFSINFDGETILEPAIDSALDQQVMDLYHRSMDERIIDGKVSGDSKAGRHLFQHLRANNAQVLFSGASDWVVFAQDGNYPADEAYFLRYILQTIDQELSNHSELDAEQFVNWIETRKQQIEAGQLVYIAHQLDFVGRVR